MSTTEVIAPYGLAFILRNKYINKNTELWPPIENIPKIFSIWFSFFYKSNGISKDVPEYPNCAHIELKNKDYSHDCCDNCIHDDNGFIVEYKMNTDSRSDVKTVFISDDGSCGNFVIGTLLNLVYPSIQTIIFDRYRGFDSNISHCDNLKIENFIAVSNQGWDNPFKYLMCMPHVRNALFESPVCFQSEYYKDYNVANGKISFQEWFSNCININKNLECIMFFSCFTPDDETCVAPFEWTRRFLKFPGPYCWIVYESSTRPLN